MNSGTHTLPRDQYDALPDRTNFSTLKHLAKSPAAYLYALLKRDDEDTDALLRGRAVHMRVFEPELFKSTFVVWEDRRAGKFWEAFEKKARLEGHEVLTAKMHEQVLQLADAIRANAMASPFLTGGKCEQTVLWDFERPKQGALEGYRVACKGRPDFIRPDCIVDLKTCRSAEPTKFAKQACELLYYAQASFYVDGEAAANGTPRKPFVIIAAEEKPPYVVQVFRVPDVVLEVGRTKYIELLDRLHVCRRDSNWPGYCTEPVELTLPPWVMGEEQAGGPRDDTFGLLFPEEEAA